MGGQQFLAGRDITAEAADPRDQLRDGVLPGDRVVQDCRIHSPAALALQDSGFRHDLGDGLHDPVQVSRPGQKPPPVRQRARVGRGISPYPHAAFQRRSKVNASASPGQRAPAMPATPAPSR